MKKLFAFALLAAFVFAGPASAQTSDLPEAGLTPASPFYFVERVFEGIGTLFAFGNSAKAQRYLTLAEERLAEAQALAEEGDERAQAAVERYQQQVAQAQQRAEAGGDIDLQSQVTDATTKHLAALDEVLERVPEQARASIEAAKERSVTGQIESLRGIAQRDPEAAVDIFSRAAEGRLMAAQARAERGGEDSEEEVNDALEEFGEYAEFGQEISSLAQGLETGTSTVEELVDRATSRHLEILQQVQLRVPEEAQEGIQRAIENAERVRDNRPEIPSEAQEAQQQGGAPADTGAGVAPVDTGQFNPSEGEEENGENEEEMENGNDNPPTDIPVTPGGASGNNPY